MSDPAMVAAMRAMKQRADNRIAQGAIAAREALAPIRELHRPVQLIHSWAAGYTRMEDRCPDCRGKAGVHACGCWSDEDCSYSCSCGHTTWADCQTALLIYTSSELEER